MLHKYKLFEITSSFVCTLSCGQIMTVIGFTIIRNAIKFDYPVVESILSVLPLVDKFYVAVGKSEDETYSLIKNINDTKIQVIETEWDLNLREGGRLLAKETDKCKDSITDEADWLLYLQADEVLHEKDFAHIREEMLKWKDKKEVEGFLFNYIHFYGSYDYIGDSRKWYRNEIRIIRQDKDICSYKDAISFRRNGKKLKVKKLNASVYHYGWVKHPKFQQQKQESFHKMWHDDEWMKKNITVTDEFDYSHIDSLQKFSGSHPSVMSERIRKMNWKFSFDPAHSDLSFKGKLLHLIEKKTGWRIGEYKNYKLLK